MFDYLQPFLPFILSSFLKASYIIILQKYRENDNESEIQFSLIVKQTDKEKWLSDNFCCISLKWSLLLCL